MSPHDRYRSRLHALADGAALAALLDRWADAHEVPSPAGGWRREYGRFHPDRPAWAVLLMQGSDAGTPLVSVELLDEPLDGSVAAGEIGWARVVPFPIDPALPGLTTVLGLLDDAHVVRYRPATRCTLSGSRDGVRAFVKVLAASSPAFDDDARELWRVRSADEVPFAVAAPGGWDEVTWSVWQGAVPGRPCVDRVLGPGGAALTARLGAALGDLARSSARPARTATSAGELARARRAAANAVRRVPDLGDRADRVIARLSHRLDLLEERPLVPVHGAPHAHQWLLDGDQLGLVDFDRFSFGEPELDVATFLAELDTERRLQQPVDVHERALVDGFESTGPSLDPARLDLYRAYKRLAKVARTAWALRPDGDRRADELLARLESTL